jgi:threonine/homoserine/homoserine lactone efflux protein
MAFLAASFILAVTPGPGVVYIVTQTLVQGRKAGLASIGGIALGNLGNATAASLGLAVVFSSSSTAFLFVKLAGAAYLVFLGLKALKMRPVIGDAARVNHVSPARLFCDGFIVALLNPKTALFFAALLPQFINPAVPPLWQSLVFGCVFVSIALCTDTIYVLSAFAATTMMRRQSGWRSCGRYVSAVLFIGLGIYAAFANPRSAR